MGKFKIGDFITYSDNYYSNNSRLFHKPLFVVEEIRQDEFGDNYFCRVKGLPSGIWLREKDMQYFIDETFTTDEIHYSYDEKLIL